MVSVPAQAVGMAQSQWLFWGHCVWLWHACCRQCHGLPRRPLQLCKECPRAGVAACQALPRHIPGFGAPSSSGGSRPVPLVGWEPCCRRSSPQLAGASPLPQAGRGESGMKIRALGVCEHSQPSWQSQGFTAPQGGAEWAAAPGDSSQAAHGEPALVLPARPQPSHLCGNSPSFFTSQKGPGIADRGPLPSRCCNPRLNRESGKLRQPRGFLGTGPSSRQR